MSWRGLCKKLHLWLGLTVGTALLVLGLSGAALVYYVPLDRWLHPAIDTQHAQPPNWDRALATLRARFPDKTGPWRLEATGDGGAIPARYYHPPETTGQGFAPMMVWLSPDGSQLLRRDYWGDYLVTWLYNLHYQLLLGATGSWVVGWLGLASALLLFSGLYSWWPKVGRWRRQFQVSAGAPALRALLEWHRLIGVLSALPLLLLCLTGAALALPGPTATLLGWTLGTPGAAPVLASQSGPQVLPSTALAAARQALPGARLAWIETPPLSGGNYRFRLQLPGDPSMRFPHSYVTVQGQSAKVLAIFDARAQGPATTFNNWLHPLHDGSAGGFWLRSLWLLAGAAPLMLFTLGIRRWRLRRRRYGEAV